MSDIWNACRNGDLIKIKQYITSGVSVNKVDKSGATALFYAASKNKTKVARYLLLHNANPETSNNSGYFPLYAACYNGHSEVVALLLTNGTTINKQTKHGYTSLRTAAINGHLQCVKYLLTHGADANLTDNKHRTPLYFACKEGHTEIVRLLLLLGAHTDIASVRNISPLYLASENGNTDMVRELLNFKPDTEIRPISGATAFIVACVDNHLGVVTSLCESGCDINAAMPSNGYTGLHWAAEKGYTNMIRYLLTQNVIIQENNNHETAVDRARLNGFTHIVSLLEVYKSKGDQSPKSSNRTAESSARAIPRGKDINNETLHTTDSIISDNIKALKDALMDEINHAPNGTDDRPETLDVRKIWKEITNVGKEIAGSQKDSGLKKVVIRDLSDGHLFHIANQLETEWKMFAGFLGVEYDDIKRLESRYASDPRFGAWTMLIEWRNSTCGCNEEQKQKLKEVLNIVNRNDLLEYM